jgi:hypothetical protein
MQIKDAHCEELRRLYRENESRDLSLDEAREILSRMLVLVERFSVWAAKEATAGRAFELPDRPSAP